LQLGPFDESYWKYYEILDPGCWMFPDVTPGASLDIQYPVSSIQDRPGITDDLLSSPNLEMSRCATLG